MVRKLAVGILLFGCVQAALAEQVDEVAQLRAQVAELTRRLEALEGRERSSVAVNVEKEPAKPIAETSKVSFKGDFRYRYEEIDLQGAELHSRTRIRARASVSSKVSDTLEFGLGLSSGGSAPTSSTQTLGNGGSKKDIDLDLAYVDWTPIEGLHVLAGKFANPLLRVPSHSMMWDDEWRPEGVALTYQNETVFATVLSTWLESDSLSPSREQSSGGHIGIRHAIGGAGLTTGVGYFDFSIAGDGTFYGSDLAFAGNSFFCSDPQDTTSCSYLNDYREVDVFAAVDFDIGDLKVKVFGHAMQNLDADEFDTGWTAGARASTTFRDRGVQFDYFYRDLEADAAYGQFSDSDFGGGGSDVAGHYFKAGFKVTPHWVLSATYFANRVGENLSTERDFSRFQLNADFNY